METAKTATGMGGCVVHSADIPCTSYLLVTVCALDASFEMQKTQSHAVAIALP
jgi:hypothetical protein